MSRDVVAAAYDALARCDDTVVAPCCAPTSARGIVGRDESERRFVGDADLGVSCGNPVRCAALSVGERVLDLGCGAGVDCLLAAREVGPSGWVIGADGSAEMVARARRRADEVAASAEGANVGKVEFRLGELERVPVASSSVDVVLSNCAINLCEDKKRVFAEAFRTLRPGGRMCVSDVLRREAELPERLKTNEALAC